MILDEPTADLDPESAELVEEAVDRLRDGRTVLLVAHRPSSSRGVPTESYGSMRVGLSSPPGRSHDARFDDLSRSRGSRAWRLAGSVLLGAAAVGFGIALMSTAGYLISRAAEQPPILSLTVTIVAVRFFALARPLARYLERLVSHDLALRTLGRIRVRFFARIEPLAPGELAGFRRGDLVSRMVGDVDALQGLYLRGLAPPLVALMVCAASVLVAAIILPAAAVDPRRRPASRRHRPSCGRRSSRDARRARGRRRSAAS